MLLINPTTMRKVALSFLAAAAGWITQPAFAAATIIINNLDGAGEGFNDPTPWVPTGGNPATTVGQARLNTFQYAANVWGSYLNSTVTIVVDSSFDPLPCTATGAVLGSAGAQTAHRDFANTPPYPAPVANTWYAQALANAIRGVDLDPTQADIRAQFNSNLGNAGCMPSTSWYYGLDAKPPPGAIDLATVLLHEFGHGLGFLTFVNLTRGAKFMTRNDTFMLNLENHGAATAVYPAMTDGQRITASIADPNLHWLGVNTLTEAGTIPLSAGFPGGHVRMHGPNPAQPGSSVSHFSTALSPNELMEPVYTGPDRDLCLTLALMRDVGWQMTVPATDLYMRDTPLDVGLEPNPDAGPMYVSEDIYVRNAADGLLAANQGVHQNPEYSLIAPNYVYVRVRNRGCQAASGELKVYWAKAGTGLVWPTHWVNYITAMAGCAATKFGDQIPTGSPLMINNLAPGAETIIEVPWMAPKPNDYACFGADRGHICLLARIETAPVAPFGMTSPEGPDVWVNTKNNNNIVWKNLTVVDAVPGLQAGSEAESVIVRNVEPKKQALVKLGFKLANKRNQDSLFQFGTIDINLGPELFAKWDRGGRQGKGFEVVGKETLRLFTTEATLENLMLEPEEWHPLGLDFRLVNRPPPKSPALYGLTVTQYQMDDAGNANPVGGQAYEINLNKIPLIPWGADWKYFDRGLDLGNAWREPGYDDRNWRSGPAQLGFGDGDEATVIEGGPAKDRFITTYFRTSFLVEDVSLIEYLTFLLKRDDGGVVYLNGVEVFRNNLPNDPMTFDTKALMDAPDDGNAIITATVPVTTTKLLNGINVVAVEIHQSTTVSDDLSFDLALAANRLPEPPEVTVAPPLIGARNDITFVSSAVDPDGTIALVEFFANLTKLGDATTPPYSLTVPNLPPGTYCVSAKATDNLGMATVSAPMLLVVPGPALGISQDKGLVTISWSGPGTLQEASILDPPDWVDIVSQPSSPYTPPVLSVQKFYRVRQ
jgi:hypothetical protein